VLAELALGHEGVTFGHVGFLFISETVGGALFGLIIGWLTYHMLKSVNNYQVEVLLTLALVMGGYALATILHISGPLAIVVAGLLIGNHGRSMAMSDTTREHLDTFWELIDEILNAVLFVFIGMEVLVITFAAPYLIAGLIAIPLVLAARFISVGIPLTLMKSRWPSSEGALTILTWGGLRGGISVALVLSLPPSEYRELLLTMTYILVAFSLLVQGLTIEKVIRKIIKNN